MSDSKNLNWLRTNVCKKKDIRRLQQSAKRAAVWSERVEASKIGAADKGYVGHKAAKMMKRSKSYRSETTTDNRTKISIAEKYGNRRSPQDTTA